MIAAVVFGGFLWASLPRDPVGRADRARLKQVGLQGQLTEHLYWDALLEPPRPDRLKPPTASGGGRLADRVLWAVVSRYARTHRLGMDEAIVRLHTEVRSPAATAFLKGKMRRAVRMHWRRRFTGPSFMFVPWYYLVITVRHGRRHLWLDAMSSILKEIRTL